MDKKFELNKYLYYFIIGILSLFVCFFFPMLGTEIGIGFNFPNTAAGWCVFVLTKVLIAVINILLYYCFMQQAKVNVRNNPHFIEANDILMRTKTKEIKPMGPKQWQAKQYGSKGIAIFIGSVLSAFCLTNAILAFDLVSMLTYVFTITSGIIFGIIQMKKAEEYWTEEYYTYALLKKEEQRQADAAAAKVAADAIYNIRKTAEEQNKCLLLTENNTEPQLNK